MVGLLIMDLSTFIIKKIEIILYYSILSIQEYSMKKYSYCSKCCFGIVFAGYFIQCRGEYITSQNGIDDKYIFKELYDLF